MTDLFAEVATRQTEALRKKTGNAMTTRVVHCLPYFEGNVYSRKAKVKGGDKVFNLNASYIINVYACIAQCIVDCENVKRTASNKGKAKADKVTLESNSIYLVELLLSKDSIPLSEYARGNKVGANEIRKSLTAFFDKESFKVNCKIDDKGLISGLSKVAKSVFKELGYTYSV